ADRPAVDAGRGHAHEHAAVEAGIVGLEGAVVGSAVEHFHGANLGRAALARSRFSDLIQILARHTAFSLRPQGAPRPNDGGGMNGGCLTSVIEHDHSTPMSEET